MKTAQCVISYATVGILAVSALTSCSSLRLGGESAPGSEKVSITKGIEAHRYRLENGLRLLVIEDDTSPTFSYQTWFGVGSRDEEQGRTGLAHLFEHMMFKGTRQVPDGAFDRLLEEAGVEGENAYTTHDHTTYIQELPKERLELIVRLEADRMRNLVVDDQSFSTEREVVQNERRYRNENNPDGLMQQELYALAYQKHSYRWPVIGYEEDLARMSATDARRFYDSHYSPANAVIVVAGNVDSSRVASLIRKYYGSYPARTAGQDPANRVRPTQEPEQLAARRKTLRLNIQVEKLLMAYPIPAMDHEDLPALDVLQTILSGGRSSRLQKALVEAGIATEAYAYSSSAKDPSLFFVAAAMQKESRANSAERIVLRELDRLSRELVPSQELERARNILNFEFYEGLDTNSERARFVGHYESQAGGAERGPVYFEKLQKVSAEEIRTVVRKYFTENRRNTVVGIRKKEST